MPDQNLLDVANLIAQFGDRIRIGDDCRIAADVIIDVGKDARLSFGDGVSVRRGTTVEVGPGATAVFGDHVDIGENVFTYVMCGLFVGDGVGISNMVDLHDHNHRERAPEHLVTGVLNTYDSGFVAAPIVIEDGAVLSNKVSVTAGVRIGANTIVGANAVVTRSLPPNAVAAGIPARVVRRFWAPVPPQRWARRIRVAFFGTSIMEHYEAYSERMFQQWNLPAVGEQVQIQQWRRRGYVDRLFRSFRVQVPHVAWECDNLSRGGGTSRDTLSDITRAAEQLTEGYDLLFVGCGLNDVWRGFQDRHAEAVDAEEYEQRIRETVGTARSIARHVIFVGETPFALPEPDLDRMNEELCRYGELARSVCMEFSVPYVDCFRPFQERARLWAAYGSPSAPTPWSDGVHLSDDGDELMVQILLGHVQEGGLLDALVDYERLEESAAATRYAALIHGWRAGDAPR